MIFVAGSALADDTQTLSISNASVTEGGDATFTISLTDGPDDATVTWATSAGSATAGTDYTESSDTVPVPKNDSVQITVPTTPDTIDEANENFTVTLSGEVGAVIGDGTGTGTINDDDASPSVSITGSASVAEGAQAQYTVSISGQSANTVSVQIATQNGTAVAPGDYTSNSTTLSWAPGETAAKTFNVSTVDDAFDEDNENFNVHLASPNGVTIADADQGTTINDGDPTPSIGAFADQSTSEGNSGSKALTFTVTLSAASGRAVTVNYSTVNGTAVAPGDYTSAINQNVTIPAGQTSATFPITIIGDTAPEGDESFTVNLNNATNATLPGDTQATGTILNDDSGVTASINDVAVTEGNAGTTNATFTISLSGPAPTASTLTWRTEDQTATAASNDYEAVGNTQIPVPQGASSVQVSVTVNGDTAPEANETFFVDLVGSSGSVSINDNRGVGTINNDDASVTASISDVAVTEGNSTTTVNATFTITLSGPAPTASTLTWRTADNTATTGNGDYDGVGNTVLNIPQNATSATVTVEVNGDNAPEPDEQFFVDLVGNTGSVTIADSRGIGTIVNDDAGVTAAINDIVVTEGNGTGTVNATFTIALSGPAPTAATVTWRTADGTATSAGTSADFNAVNNTVANIPQSATSVQVTVVVRSDNVTEPDETFFVDLVGSTGSVVSFSDNRGIGTITNDDSGVTASINDVTVSEGNGTGTVNATFTIALSAPAPGPSSITWRTTDGTATSVGTARDFDGVPNTVLPIAQGATSAQVTVVVRSNNVPEPTESFFVDLVTSTGSIALSPDTRGIGTINDDDAPVSASIGDVSVTEGDTGTVSANFTVTLSGPAQAAVQIRYSTVDSSATAPADYTAVSNALLTIASGQSSGSFTILVNSDTVYEGDENFFVDLISSNAAATIDLAHSRGKGTIVENEAAPPPPPTPGGGGGGGSVPSLSIDDPLTSEGAQVTFTITLSARSSSAVTVRASTVNGTATGGNDFVARDETLTFAPGETSKSVSLAILDDTDTENTETFWLRLSAPTNATIGKTLGTATIAANDGVTPTGVPPTTVPLPRIVIGPRTLSANKNAVVIVRVSCTRISPIPCSGRIELETSTGLPKLLLGKKGFSMLKGKTVTLYIKLSTKGVTRLLKTGSLRVRAVVFVKDGNKKLRRFVAGFLPLRASTALAAKHGQAKTLTVTPKPKPKAKPAPKPEPPPQIIVGG